MNSLATVVAVAVTVLGRSAFAEDRDKAFEAYSRAAQHYKLREFKEALAAFEDAYLNFEDPAFLFNLAQCHRFLGDDQQATREYRLYLVKVPDASNRTAVLELVAKLEKKILDEQTNRTVPPEPEGIPAPGATPPLPTAPLVAASPPMVEPRAPPRPTPVYKKWWLWTAVGAAAAIAIGVGVGVSQSGATPTANTALGTFRL